MAAQRRRWQENLRNDCKTEISPKKPKIKVHREEIFMEQCGKLVLKKVFVEQNGKLVLQKEIKNLENESDMVEKQFSASTSSIQEKNITSPHQKRSDVENLTPTFRKPENYLVAAAEFMKEISPKSDQVDTIHDEGNNISNYSINHNLWKSDIVLEIDDEELNMKENDNHSINLEDNNISLDISTLDQKQLTDTIAQEFGPLQCISKKNKYLLESPDWAKNESYEVKVTIERNSGSYYENTNTLIESKSEKGNQMKTMEVLKETKNISNVYLTEKIKNGLQKQVSIFADTSDVIKPASDSDLIHSADEKSTKKFIGRSKRKLNFDKSYLDFVDDDLDTLFLNEAFPSEESSFEFDENETYSCSSDSEQVQSKQDKKKKNLKKNRVKKIKKTNQEKVHHLPVEKCKSKTEIKHENTLRKKKGQSYTNTKGEIVEGKRIKPNPCIGVQCGNNCSEITEERRINIFTHFWGLGSYQRRKDWITHCAVRRSVKRPSKSALLNRSQSYEYFINEGEGRRKVCQKFLIATLDVTQRFILYTLDTMVDGFAKEDGRGQAGGCNKTSEDVLQEAKKFLLDLPLLPSHYCRRDSTKMYLPEEFKSVSNLYRIYLDHCEGKKKMSLKLFSTWFKKSFNIGFHVPKKDKCALCTASKTFDVKTKDEMNTLLQHQTEKEESYKRFIFHQNLNKTDKGTICASFDLQKVLNTPYGESMILYYSRKVAVYNFTIYESHTKLGICNVWTEADAKRGANEIASCLLEYLQNVDKRGNVKQIILYCDSAYGQNKNKTISENVETIQINYLIPGHTYMPVDSMHATIEGSVKNSIIWAPSQWPTVIQFSRKNPKPYVVNVLNGEDFSGFDNVVEYTFKKKQAIQISKISIVTFQKKHPQKMFVKYSMLPDTKVVKVELNSLSNAIPKLKLYPAKLPISQKKYSDLKTLVEKQIIPKRFAKEYLDLKTSAKVRDCLPDTDVEDES